VKTKKVVKETKEKRQQKTEGDWAYGPTGQKLVIKGGGRKNAK